MAPGRGVIKPGKLSIVEREMESHDISILGIGETHMRRIGHFKTASGNTMYFSGLDDSSLHGVGFIMSAKMNQQVPWLQSSLRVHHKYQIKHQALHA